MNAPDLNSSYVLGQRAARITEQSAVALRQKPSLWGRAEHCLKTDSETKVGDVKATGGSVRELLWTKWAQRGQLCTTADEKLNPRLESEKRNSRKDREQSYILIRHQHFLLGKNT